MELFGFLFVGPEVILLGIAVLVALHLVSAYEVRRRGDVLYTVLAVVGWALVAIGGMGVLTSLFLVFGVVGLVLWLAAAIVLAEAVLKRRVNQRYALLWLLTVAAERLVPLAPAILAFSREQRGHFSWRVRQLAEMLNAGVPLPEALRRSPGLLPHNTLPIVCVGYESGALGPALRRVAARADLPGTLAHALIGKLLYICALPFFGLCVTAFVMLQIVPAYQKILADFGLPLPALTQALIDLAGGFYRHGVLLALVLSLVFLAGLLLFSYAVLRYIGAFHWDLPGLGRLTRRFDTANVLEALALAAEHQSPLRVPIASLAGSYPKRSIRRRLDAVLLDLEGGAPWCESLWRCGLIGRADLAILQAAGRLGNLPWALREMADSNRRRLAYRLQALVQLLFPPVVITFGGLVMFFVVALFLPLISMIERLVQP